MIRMNGKDSFVLWTLFGAEAVLTLAALAIYY